MQSDPIVEWQRLSEHYRQMCNEELRELAADFGNLTGTAQQALRGEMRSRGMGEPEDAIRAPEFWRPAREKTAIPQAESNPPLEPDAIFAGAAGAIGIRPPELVPDGGGAETHEDIPHEYTWKTLLCHCETREQALALREALTRAGIDSWIEASNTYSHYVGPAFENPRILVAADQLEQARAIAAQPIPREILQESTVEVPEFVEPKCPKCGSDDVVLEGVDNGNNWRCEQCGEKWSDAAEVAGQEPENPDGEAP